MTQYSKNTIKVLEDGERRRKAGSVKQPKSKLHHTVSSIFSESYKTKKLLGG